MKKIAIVSSLSGVGGTEVSLLSLLKALPENCFDIELLLIGESGRLINEVPDWIKIRHIASQGEKEYVIHALKKARLFKAVIGILRYLRLKINWKKYKTDTMLQYNYSLYLYEMIKDKYDVAISWFVPNSVETVYTLQMVKAEKKALWIHMDVSNDKMPPDSEKVFNGYDKIFCVSESCNRSFCKEYPLCSDKAEVFYNIIDKKEILSKAGEPAELLSNDVFRIVTCGRIADEKQPLLALDIAKKLIDEGFCNFKWYFIGDGVLLDEMKRIIRAEGLENYIIMLGVRTNPYPLIRQCDLYVQMSLHESFCLTLAEAQLLGVPAVSTDFPSAHEIINEDVTGFIASDKQLLFDKIKYLIKNRDNVFMDINENNIVPTGDINKFIRFIDSDAGC